MTQREWIVKIVALALKNPEAKIKFCVDNELVADFGWTAHEIKRVAATMWIEAGERIYTDEDLAKDEIADMLYDDNRNRRLNQLDFDSLVDKYFRENSIKAICVFTAGDG